MGGLVSYLQPNWLGSACTCFDLLLDGSLLIHVFFLQAVRFFPHLLFDNTQVSFVNSKREFNHAAALGCTYIVSLDQMDLHCVSHLHPGSWHLKYKGGQFPSFQNKMWNCYEVNFVFLLCNLNTNISFAMLSQKYLYKITKRN